MAMLRAKLAEREERVRQEEIAREKGEAQDVNFGSQIRSYVLHPYTLVKDLRTSYETGDVQRVLDGDLDEFVRAFLLWRAAVSELSELVDRALAEDVGSGDVTAQACVPADARARATVTQKEAGVIFGLEPALLAFRALDPDVDGRGGRAGGRVGRGGQRSCWSSRASRGRCSPPSARRSTSSPGCSGIATAAARGGRGAGGDRSRACSTRARRRPGCARSRRRRSPRAAPPTTATASTTPS